jgi:hypothetical protein
MTVGPRRRPFYRSVGDISDETRQLTCEVNIHAMSYVTKAAVPHG